MTGQLHKLVYTSRNKILGSNQALQREVEEILHVARTNNSKRGITGALIFTPSRFAQVLEGPRQKIESVYEKICLDPRHADLVVLQFEPISSRAFEAWSMGYAGKDPRAITLFASVCDAPFSDQTTIQGEKIHQILLSGTSD